MKVQEKIMEYALGLDTPKWVLEGGQILKYIGSEVIVLDYKKENDTWKSDTYRALIKSIWDYDPMTCTYEIIYDLYKDTEKIEQKTRIIPEGFEFGDPETQGRTLRFIPYSEHFRRTEEELYYLRLKTLYNTKTGLGPEQIKQLHKESLSTNNYIAAVIDSDTEAGKNLGIMSFRISEITPVTQKGNKDVWNFGIRDQGGFFIMVPKFKNDPGKGWICENLSIQGEILGDLKIIDIQD